MARAAVVGWAAAVMGVVGLIGPSWGPALVPARARFHLGLVAAGTLFLVFGGARTAGAMLSAALSDHLPRRGLLLAYGTVLSGGLAGVALAPGWPAVLAGAAAVGFAFGAVSTEANAVVAQAGGGTRGRDISVVNAVYSAGAALGPVTVGALLRAHLGWRPAFALWAVLAVVPFLRLAAIAGRLPGPAARAREAAGARRRAPTAPRQAPSGRPDHRVLALAAMAFLYIGTGWTVSGWAATYLVGRFGAGLLTGTLGSSIFYACLAVGRLANARAAGTVAVGNLLRIEAVLSAVALLGLALAGGAVAALAAFGAAGLCLAGIYPNLIAHATDLHPDRPGAMSGLMSTGGAVGASLVPFAAAALGRAAGLGAMTWLLVGLGVALVAASTVAARAGRPRPDPAGTPSG